MAAKENVLIAVVLNDAGERNPRLYGPRYDEGVEKAEEKLKRVLEEGPPEESSIALGEKHAIAGKPVACRFFSDHDRLREDLREASRNGGAVYERAVAVNLADEGFKGDPGKSEEVYEAIRTALPAAQVTGATKRGFSACEDKIFGRTVAEGAGANTCRAVFAGKDESVGAVKEMIEEAGLSFPLLAKPYAGGGSLGISEQKSVAKTKEKIEEALAFARSSPVGSEITLIEEMALGRDLTVGVIGLGCPSAPSVNLSGGAFQPARGRALPPVEVSYEHVPEGRVPMLSREAKWEPESLLFPEGERERRPDGKVPFGVWPHVLDRMSAMSVEIASRSEARGYARVDWRFGEGEAEKEHAEPFFLEVNANPGWGPGAHLMQGMRREGLGYRELIWAIIEEAYRRTRPG